MGLVSLGQPIPVSEVGYGDMAWSHYPALSPDQGLCFSIWPHMAASCNMTISGRLL